MPGVNNLSLFRPRYSATMEQEIMPRRLGRVLSTLARLFLVGGCSLSGANVGISISSNDVWADTKQWLRSAMGASYRMTRSTPPPSPFPSPQLMTPE